ncbi:MAG: Crp/Fnr family transcriptional regulator [Eubacterium sp.]|jgi:CRP/FNR family transcriptional regulator|nr:Crp/Fnr family transcriptional regulator [Eubacterium sp.]
MNRSITESVLKTGLPFWEHLTKIEKYDLINNSIMQEYKSGALIHRCTDVNSPGIQIIRHGKARVFISSPDGKQLTLQRIGDYQLFVIGISCLLNETIFDVSLETETQCEVLLIPRVLCKKLFDSNVMAKSIAIDILVSSFAKTMRILEAIAFTSTRSRVANALIEQSFLSGSSVINVTHASIAADLGTTREVVTRILNQFKDDGLVTLQKQKIQIDKKQELINIQGDYLGHINNLLYPKPLK